MYKPKVLRGFIVLAYILFVVFQFNGSYVLAKDFKALIIPLFTLVYFLNVKRKILFFTLFLVLYSISDLMTFLEEFISFEINYFLGNSLYILAYIFLILHICKLFCFHYILKHFIFHFIVLTALSIYIVYVLQVLIFPEGSPLDEYFTELIYNSVLLILLSVSSLNYFYRDNKKSLFFFIGALCIVFAEVIWIAYAYIDNVNFFNLISETLYVFSFYFFLKQCKFKNERHVNIIMD